MASASKTHQRPALLLLEACPAEPVLDPSGAGLAGRRRAGLLPERCRRHGARIETDGDFAEYPKEAMSSLEAGGAYLDETPFGPQREHTRFVVADLQQGY